MEKCWACSKGCWGSFCASAVWWTCFTAPLHAANKWTHWTLWLLPPCGLSHYSTRCLETLHDIPFHSTLTQYPVRLRSDFVCVTDGQTGFFSVFVVLLMLSISKWSWVGTAPQEKSCMRVWIIPTKTKSKKKMDLWHLCMELVSSHALLTSGLLVSILCHTVTIPPRGWPLKSYFSLQI